MGAPNLYFGVEITKQKQKQKKKKLFDYLILSGLCSDTYKQFPFSSV